MNESKSPLLSKTIWMSWIMASIAFIPPAQEFIVANMEAFGVVIGLVFTGLRLITKGKVDIK